MLRELHDRVVQQADDLGGRPMAMGPYDFQRPPNAELYIVGPLGFEDPVGQQQQQIAGLQRQRPVGNKGVVGGDSQWQGIAFQPGLDVTGAY